MQSLRDLAATDFAAAGSPQGKAWMASLPSLLHDLASQWNLTTTGDLLGHGYNAVVLPVRQDGRPLALKLTWPPSGSGKRRTRWPHGGHEEPSNWPPATRYAAPCSSSASTPRGHWPSSPWPRPQPRPEP